MQEQTVQDSSDVSTSIPAQPAGNVFTRIFMMCGAIVVFILIGLGGYTGYRLLFNDAAGEQTELDRLAEEEAHIEEDMIYQEETASVPEWIRNDPMKKDDGPWYEDLYIATSDDGLTFSNEQLFLPHAGVGHLLLTDDAVIIATFQYFSYRNEDLFDVIAYATSEDFGETWSSVKPITITGLPEGPNAVDPTLMQLEDGTFRLYFTYHQRGDQFPQLFSAYANSIEEPFENEGKQLETEEMVLDPAVIYFDNTWHHYTVKHEDGMMGSPDDQVSVHSTSSTGLNFNRQEDIMLDFGMLGDVIQDNDGMRFYAGEKSAFSTDGYTWTMDPGTRGVMGADPGVAMLPDGSYIMIYTSMGMKE